MVLLSHFLRQQEGFKKEALGVPAEWLTFGDGNAWRYRPCMTKVGFSDFAHVPSFFNSIRQKQKLPFVTETDKESEGFQKGEWRISVRCGLDFHM